MDIDWLKTLARPFKAAKAPRKRKGGRKPASRKAAAGDKGVAALATVLIARVTGKAAKPVRRRKAQVLSGAQVPAGVPAAAAGVTGMAPRALAVGKVAARLVNPLALLAVGCGLASCAFFDFEPPTPDDFPVKGIDVSYYQEDINWNAVRAANTAFAWIKVTEGGDWKDPKFDQNWYESAAAGVNRGAYHFWYFCRPAMEQVSWFIEHVPYDATALPPVLDMEWTDSKTCPTRPPRSQILSEMKVWLDAVERYYGKRPVIYTTVDFYRDRLRGAFPDYHIWVRSVRGHPMVRYGDLRWHFWQHTAEGRIPGIRGKVDKNVFYGSRREWQEFVAGELPPEE